jgi:hypothetical protein
MVKIYFTNAEVEDDGWGLRVNGKSLEDIISMALGTKAEGVSYGDPRQEKLKKFKANACNITVIIDPRPKEVQIEDDDFVYNSVEELEEELNERIGTETTEAES